MRDDGKAALAMHGAPRGRGAASYVGGRFEKRVARSEDDGWGSAWDPNDAAGELAPPPHPDTRVTDERARSLVSRNQSPAVVFSPSVNPYLCYQYSCLYFFERPSHYYHDPSGSDDHTHALPSQLHD